MLIATLLRPGSFFRERNCERSLEQSTLTEERNTDNTHEGVGKGATQAIRIASEAE